MAIPHPLTQHVTRDDAAFVVSQAGAQMAGFWRMKIARALDAFEAEARRMLSLETQLGEFAVQYELLLGEVTDRLASLEEQMGETPGNAELLAMRAQQEQRTARQNELRARYRTLAMDIHPDRAQLADDSGAHMQRLTAMYRGGDLAGLLKLEAQLYLARITGEDFADVRGMEAALRDVARASETYAQGYRALLNSPANDLMLRVMSARREGWEMLEVQKRKIERSIFDKEQMMIAAMSASGIGLERSLV